VQQSYLFFTVFLGIFAYVDDVIGNSLPVYYEAAILQREGGLLK